MFSKEKKEKLDTGLQKTKEGVWSKITRAVAGKSKVDDEVLDNLEEAFITSDVGVDTTLKIIERIEDRVARDKYVNSEELNSLLCEEITDMIARPESDNDRTQPHTPTGRGNPYGCRGSALSISRSPEPGDADAALRVSGSHRMAVSRLRLTACTGGTSSRPSARSLALQLDAPAGAGHDSAAVAAAAWLAPERAANLARRHCRHARCHAPLVDIAQHHLTCRNWRKSQNCEVKYIQKHPISTEVVVKLGVVPVIC